LTWSIKEDPDDASTDLGSRLNEEASSVSDDGSLSAWQHGDGPSRPPGVHTQDLQLQTLKLQNLPPHFRRDDLLVELGRHGFYPGTDLDFIHVPMEHLTGHTNMGYGIVNMRSSDGAGRLLSELQGFQGWQDGSDEVLEVLWNAPEQGCSRLIETWRNSRVMHRVVDDAVQPALFSVFGRVPFPKPTHRMRRPAAPQVDR
jgi:hypothetical protein